MITTKDLSSLDRINVQKVEEMKTKFCILKMFFQQSFSLDIMFSAVWDDAF